MKPFLKETAEDIIRKHSDNLNRVCIVFPNKRTRMFFRKYYAETLGKTSWSAKFIDLKTLVSSIAGLNEPDRLSTVFDLYEIFRNRKHSNIPFNFDKFYQLGEIILNDFSEIDSWLIDVSSIFKNIRNINEIDSSYDWLSDEQKEIILNFWKNFSPERMSDEKTKFLEMLNILPSIHKDLTELLLSRNSGYAGMLFRRISDLIDNETVFKPEYNTFIFIGFNALTAGEEKLFLYFQKQGRAEFYWDADNYYVSDLKQEAGDFIRKNFRAFGKPETPLPENLKNLPKNIDLIGIPQNSGQAKIVASLLEKYNITKPDTETAVVISDENLLFPILYSLPKSVDKLNVTMGFPIRETILFGLISQYLKLHERLQKRDILSKKIAYSDIVAILKHSYVFNFSPESSKKYVDEINKKNQLFIEISMFSNPENELIRLIFAALPAENSGFVMLTNLMNILVLIFNRNPEKNQLNTLEKEFFFRAYMKIKRLKEILINKNINADFELITKLLHQVLSTEQVPFKGDAVEGMQLMGVLETRNLDFKNVIILGLNEGNFPKSQKPQSFLSQNIRYAFGLPVEKFRDSVYAYFFYRIIQRAENICLVYNTVVSGENGGEMSRFIKQLLFESNLKINKISVKQELKPNVPSEISVKKDSAVLEKLNDFIEQNGTCKRLFSASSLNDFMDCPLKFYFKHIAELKPAKKPEEELSPADFGSIFHMTLEKLYSELKIRKGNRTVEINDFEYLKQITPEAIRESFAAQFGKDETENFDFEGFQIIIKDVILSYVNTILDFDKTNAPFEILNLEDKYKFRDFIKIDNRSVGIKGTFDRIDFKNGEYQIIDYKTGKPEKIFLSFDDVFGSQKISRRKEIFQIFLYGFLCTLKMPETKNHVVPALYDVKSMNDDEFSPLISMGAKDEKKTVDSRIFAELLPEFLSGTIDILRQIFDEDLKFYQTRQPENCKYCDFKSICRK
jgi:hypothetical protein